MEIELKYSLASDTIAESIKNDEDIKELKVEGSEKEMELYAIYYDTEDELLRKNHIAFRIREEGGRNIATLKWGGGVDEALHQREELNINLGSGDFPKTPDISVFSQSQIGEKILQVVGDKKLLPIMNIHIFRDLWRVEDGKNLVEICIDKGEVITEKGSCDIHEVEIELLTGDSEDLIRRGMAIAEKYNLQPEKRSKFARGLELLGR